MKEFDFEPLELSFWAKDKETIKTPPPMSPEVELLYVQLKAEQRRKDQLAVEKKKWERGEQDDASYTKNYCDILGSPRLTSEERLQYVFLQCLIEQERIEKLNKNKMEVQDCGPRPMMLTEKEKYYVMRRAKEIENGEEIENGKETKRRRINRD